MSLPDDWHGRTQTALSEQPSLSLDVYSYGGMTRKREGDAVTEYAVGLAHVKQFHYQGYLPDVMDTIVDGIRETPSVDQPSTPW